MRNRAMCAVLTAVLVTGTSAQEPAGTAAKGAKAEAVIDNGELMDLILEPLYNELKAAVEKPPQTRKDFAAIYSAAARLAEASNLLFIRSPGRYTSEPEWPALSAAMRLAAADVAQATFVALRNARTGDLEPLKVKYRAVADACNACHDGVKASDVKPIKP